jgi:hypothetical protein
LAESPVHGRPVGRPLGGWLLLAGVTLVATPALQAFGLYQLSHQLEPLPPLSGWAWTYLIVSVAISVALKFAAPVYLAVLFLRRLREFPDLFIWWILLVAGSQIADSVVAEVAFSAGYDTTAEVLPILLWVPYFARTARIKETFVN